MKIIPIFLLLTVLGAAASSANTISNTSHWGFETFLRECIEEPNPSYINTCNANGIDYETFETSLHTSQGDKVSFKTETVLANNSILKQKLGRFTIRCSACNSSVTNYDDVLNLTNQVKQAFYNNALNQGFSTRRTSRNGRATNAPSANNDGRDFYEKFKDFADGTKTFQEIWDKFLNSEKKNNPYTILYDSQGKTLAIITLRSDGGFEMVLDFSKPTTTSGGRLTFSALTTSDNARSLESSVITAGSGIGRSCRITLTGTVDRMIANVTCY